MSSAITLSNVGKSYGAIAAVDDVSFSVACGEIFGLLGPNGAGKTTLIECVAGLRAFDTGAFSILGEPSENHDAEFRRRTSFMLQKAALPPNSALSDLVEFYCSIYRVRKSVDEVLSRFNLESKATAAVKTLSGGQLQRFSLCLALLGNPEVLFVDEPTSALDPQSRRMVWDLLHDLSRNHKVTVVLTTHAIGEAAAICDRVAIIDRGRLLAIDTPEKLVETYVPGRAIIVRTPEPKLFEGLAPEILSSGTEGTELRIRSGGDDAWRLIADALSSSGDLIHELRVQEASLEDVFLELTGKSLRD